MVVSHQLLSVWGGNLGVEAAFQAAFVDRAFPAGWQAAEVGAAAGAFAGGIHQHGSLGVRTMRMSPRLGCFCPQATQVRSGTWRDLANATPPTATGRLVSVRHPGGCRDWRWGLGRAASGDLCAPRPGSLP